MRADAPTIPTGRWYALPEAVRLLIVTAMDVPPIPTGRWYVRLPGAVQLLILTVKLLLVVVDVREIRMVRLFAVIHREAEPL
jgi:hypothetical protein